MTTATTVTFVGAKGGVATSTIAAFHAIQLARLGRTVRLSATDGVDDLAAIVGEAEATSSAEKVRGERTAAHGGRERHQFVFSVARELVPGEPHERPSHQLDAVRASSVLTRQPHAPIVPSRAVYGPDVAPNGTLRPHVSRGAESRKRHANRRLHALAALLPA